MRVDLDPNNMKVLHRGSTTRQVPSYKSGAAPPTDDGQLALGEVAVSATIASSPPPDSTVIPPPTPTSGPLLERLPNRALPDVEKAQFRWARTLPLFLLLCGVFSVAIFNYQKSTSPTVASILYALRTNPTVREVLGDEIYFASKVPWISGELNPLQGRINISFWVRGTKTTGLVKFVSLRRRSGSFFETTEWSLKTEDGTELQLLELGDDVEVPVKSGEAKLQV
ncbi:hypothetical protein DV736_g6060, partial [Chaetothyriales sp. CBS 134916]